MRLEWGEEDPGLSPRPEPPSLDLHCHRTGHVVGLGPAEVWGGRRGDSRGRARRARWAVRFRSSSLSWPGDECLPPVLGLRRRRATGTPIRTPRFPRPRARGGKGRLRAAGPGASSPLDPASEGEGNTERCPNAPLSPGTGCLGACPSASGRVAVPPSSSLGDDLGFPVARARDGDPGDTPHPAPPPAACVPGTAGETEAQRHCIGPRVRGQAGQDPAPDPAGADTPLPREEGTRPALRRPRAPARPWRRELVPRGRGAAGGASFPA